MNQVLKSISTAFLLCAFSTVLNAQVYQVYSPNKKISVSVEVGESVSYQVDFAGETILLPSKISMTLDGNELGINTKVTKVSRHSVSNMLTPVVPRKFNTILDEYNEMTLQFRGKYALTFRVYDEGAAYRWETSLKGDVIVNSELVSFNFTRDHKIWFPEEEDTFSDQERAYKYLHLSEVDDTMFCSTPMLVDLENNRKVFISEAELMDYPGMFLKGKNDFSLGGKFAHFPVREERLRYSHYRVMESADYLAKTSGARKYPWRVMVFTEDDAQLIESEIIYKLSSPLKIDDVSWIKPGKVAWEWWSAINIYGVDFKAGINTDTYRYFIDFASSYNIPYILIDLGWAVGEDLLAINKDLDLENVLQYGKENGVGILLWVNWKTLDDQMETALSQFEKWGVKGIKVDYMRRDDQKVVNFYYRVAHAAAKHKLLVDFHGCYKPTGMSRAYPNVLTYEAVKGLEQYKFPVVPPSPEHNVTIPFIRMVAGPMDYTPGAMRNSTERNYREIYHQPMSMGTRCHQLAMYVIYESPLQMLADNPSNYYREPESMEFLREVLTVWEDTKVLKAKVGDYIALARKSGNRWFLGAMTDWDARTLELDMSFLEDGEYELHTWQDGINADRYASDLKKTKTMVTRDSKVMVNMAPGGGWAGIIVRK